MSIKIKEANRVGIHYCPASGAFYHKEIGEFLLPYDVARNAKSSDDVPLSFLQTTYEAAAICVNGIDMHLNVSR
jgi:hypothetical protein